MDEEDVVYTMEYYATIANENFAIFSNTDGLRGHHANWNNSNKYQMLSLICAFWKI